MRDSETTYDVAIIGGGAAGLTAAVTLGRSRRSVVVIDSGAPRNAPSEGVHMFLTRDGMKPAELTEVGRQEARHYGATIIDGEATAARRTEGGFEVSLADGTTVAAQRLLVTTGLVDELPDVPGVRELWGKDVHHCPYCHGWELQGKSVGVLATNAFSLHQAFMFGQLVSDLTVYLHNSPALTEEQAEQLAARDIQVVEGIVEALHITDGSLTGVRLQDGRIIAQQALTVRPRLIARSAVLASLGLLPVEHPMGVGEYIPGDATGLTAEPGVWVAGNVVDLMAGVVNAAAAGMTAASAINGDLIAEDTRRAVERYRHTHSSVNV